jgi:hypothetical protein
LVRHSFPTRRSSDLDKNFKFKSTKDNQLVKTDSIAVQMKKQTSLIYETAKYLLTNNKKLTQ